MAHSWIPKRAYDEGYIRFLWEMPPVILGNRWVERVVTCDFCFLSSNSE
jgi:hypothetical protein